MFTTKGLFSEIHCPYQSNCLLPRCIFWHPEQSAQALLALVNRDEIDLGHDEGEPGKRQKVDDENESLNCAGRSSWRQSAEALEREATVGSLSQASSKGPRGDVMGQQVIFTREREISPPPLRRKVQNGAALPLRRTPALSGNSSTPLKAHTSSIASSSVIPKIEVKTPSKVLIKQEGLNPRAIKGRTPATHDIRYRLLRALHDQFLRLNSELANDANDSEEKLVLSEQELITKALDLEENAAATPSIYSNVVKNKILVYKKMTVPQWKEERRKEIVQSRAKEVASMSDTPVSKPTGAPKVIETGLSPKNELSLLPRLYTPVTGLAKHGYVTTIPTDTEIESAKQGFETAKGWEVCDRCKSRFQVFPGRREEDGALASGGTCTYHFGKPYWPERSAGDPTAKREKKYRCCGELMGDSPGCTQADCHVFKISDVKRLAAVLNFAKTPENSTKVSDCPVCIDGEMGYTVHGLELIRLTATSWPSGEELFDVLVRPIGEVLDLNSRYSGVWPKNMAEAIPWDAPADVTPSTTDQAIGRNRKLRIVNSPAAARSLLFSTLTPHTPLVGHGLENDLNATRIIHPTIIDTALLFPHKAGLPYRNGLKMLMHTHLNRHIQVVVDGKMDGHDSKEDANAAGELVRFALANEWQKMQREGWTLEDGQFKHAQPQGSAPVATPTVPRPQLEGQALGKDAVPSVGKKRPRQEAEEFEDGEVDE